MTDALPILLYHSIGWERPGEYARWVVTPARFETHLSVICDEGFTPMTVEAFVTARITGTAIPERTVIITFDDGLVDFLTGAMPILSRFGFPVTLYVTSGYVGGSAGWLADLGQGARPMMSWRQIASLAEAGIEIGAHSVSHPQLDILGRERAVEEIAGSRRAIEDALGRPVRTFAYPHGYSTVATRQITAEAGFLAACSVRHAFSSRREDRFSLSRIIVEESMGAAEISGFLAGKGLAVAPTAFRPAIFGWRQARRIKQLMTTAR
jgi:O-antigen biosynthesis protein